MKKKINIIDFSGKTHLGDLVKRKMEDHCISPIRLSEKLDLEYRTFCRNLNDGNFKVDKIIKLTEFFRHDFIGELARIKSKNDRNDKNVLNMSKMT
ncbi:MAG: hypothetical protein LBR13_07210 [Dysgonamonadaceae bacterium]|nr:hypothetical protein [Dysgonamonadaceae bacterium]